MGWAGWAVGFAVAAAASAMAVAGWVASGSVVLDWVAVGCTRLEALAAWEDVEVMVSDWAEEVTKMAVVVAATATAMLAGVMAEATAPGQKSG